MADETDPTPDASVDARVAGYSWSDINAHVDQSSAAAMAAGYTQPEINAYQGYTPPGSIDAGFANSHAVTIGDKLDEQHPLEAATHGFINPAAKEGDPLTSGEVPQPLRQAYSNAIRTDAVTTTPDFSDHWAASLGDHATPDQQLRAGQELTAQLPSTQDLTDHAIALTHQAGIEPSAPLVRITKDNLVEHYAATGEDPQQATARAAQDPDFLTQMVTNVQDAWKKDEALGNAIREGWGESFENTSPEQVKAFADMLGGGIFGKTAAAAVKTLSDVGKVLTGGPEIGAVARAAPELMQQFGMTPGDADRTMRDGLGLLAALGADAPNLSVIGKAPSIADTLETIKLGGIHPEAASIIAKAAPDIIQPIAQAEAKPVVAARVEAATKPAEGEPEPPVPPTPEAVAGENAGRTIWNHFTDGMRDLWQNEEGAIHLPNGLFRTPEQFAENIRQFAAKEHAQTTLQSLIGQSYRNNMAGWRTIEGQMKDLEKYVPEYEAENEGIAKAGGDFAYRYDYNTGTMRPRSTLGQLVDYMDGRTGREISPGVNNLGEVPVDHPLYHTVEALRSVLGGMRAEIERRGPESVQNFVEHYLPRLYKDPARFTSAKMSGRAGSLANTLRRSIPYQVDAVAEGHVPRFPNPAEASMHYVDAMRKFLDQDNLVRAGKEMGHVYTATAPRPPAYEGADPDVELIGRGQTIVHDKEMTQAQAKEALDIGIRGPAPHTGPNLPYADMIKNVQELGNNGVVVQHTYAAARWAKVYNNYYKTFSPKTNSIYRSLLFASNASVAAQLGLSLYHVGDILAESYTSGLARILGNVEHGEIGRALGGLISWPVEPLRMYLKGKAGQAVYMHSPTEKEWANMNNGATASFQEKFAHLAAQVNLHPVGRDMEYMVGRLNTIWTAMRRGGYGHELMQRLQDVADRMEGKALVPQAGHLVAGAAGFIIGEAGRVLDSIMTPVFDKLIPRLKYGSWLSEMGDFMRRNPNAQPEETLGFARKLGQSMDDRFGEMVQDNLHMNQLLRRMLNVSVVSLGWEYGTIHAYYGAIKNTLNGNFRSPQARWLPAFLMQLAAGNSIVQYLMTGKTPFETGTAMKDMLVGFRTGGQTPEGAPERGFTPGYQKDPMSWYQAIQKAGMDPVKFAQAIAHLAGNKANNFVGLVSNIFAAKDFQDYRQRVMQSYTSMNMAIERLRGTNIPVWAERAGLMRPISPRLEDPARAAAQDTRSDLYAKIQELSIQRSHNRRLDHPDPQVEADTTDQIETAERELRAGQERQSNFRRAAGEGMAGERTSTSGADEGGVVLRGGRNTENPTTRQNAEEDTGIVARGGAYEERRRRTRRGQ